jgi:hypothetical protein
MLENNDISSVLINVVPLRNVLQYVKTFYRCVLALDTLPVVALCDT